MLIRQFFFTDFRKLPASVLDSRYVENIFDSYRKNNANYKILFILEG